MARWPCQTAYRVALVRSDFLCPIIRAKRAGRTTRRNHRACRHLPTDPDRRCHVVHARSLYFRFCHPLRAGSSRSRATGGRPVLALGCPCARGCHHGARRQGLVTPEPLGELRLLLGEMTLVAPATGPSPFERRPARAGRDIRAVAVLLEQACGLLRQLVCVTAGWSCWRRPSGR